MASNWRRYRTFKNKDCRIEIGYSFQSLVFVHDKKEYELSYGHETDNLIDGLYSLKYFVENNDTVEFMNKTYSIQSTKEHQL